MISTRRRTMEGLATPMRRSRAEYRVCNVRLCCYVHGEQTAKIVTWTMLLHASLGNPYGKRTDPPRSTPTHGVFVLHCGITYHCGTDGVRLSNR
jgi:hypothetical protein